MAAAMVYDRLKGSKSREFKPQPLGDFKLQASSFELQASIFKCGEKEKERVT
jgi:hypothetical protein